MHLEEQKFEENTAKSLIQTRTFNFKLSGEYVNFQQFMQQFKGGPRLLLENPTPAQQGPKLRIEMLLSVPKRLQIPVKENNL